MTRYYKFLVFFSVTGSRYLGDGGTDRRDNLYDATYGSRTYRSLAASRREHKTFKFGPNFSHLTANISKTVRRSVTCQLELKISSTTGQISTMYSMGR